ncbi:hypothetical protein B0H10DRAFT_1648037, partial [Mycena sp. CBHHK59/15]
YVARTCKINGEGDYYAGGGAWFAPNDPKNRPVGVPKNMATQNTRELAAVLHVIQSTPENIILNFQLKSKHLV